MNQPVIVIMKDQFAQAPVGSDAAAVRADAISSAQQPLTSELAQVHATNIKRYTLVNAVAATVSTGEVARLRAEAGVAEVIPDVMLNFAGSEPVTVTKSTAHKKSSGSGPALNNIPGACTTTPQLTPEGLALTSVASSKSSQPTAASLGITGAGVKVAYIADGIDPDNINFIRADGKTAFSDYEDFTAAGGGTQTDGGEAFLDANTIAGQGLHTYSVNGFGVQSYSTPCNIKIRGVAPGASLVGLNVFAENTDTTESNFLQAINYAVEQEHVNVLNESFGSNNFPDVQALDVTDQFDNAAVAAGVVVSVSTGDAGPFDTIGSPSSDPNVIAAGASTQLEAYAQANFDGTRYFSANGWLSDGVSALSSGGWTKTGGTVDVLAPGDTSWASCEPNPNYADCYNNNGNLSDIEEAGGTSEAAPWVSGVAALIIQAYAKTHSGAHPSPALVKQILMSTATDLGVPANEQGAGLVNAYKAVQLAESINTSSPTGSTLLLSKSQLNATGAPGSTHSWPVTVTNTGSSSQTVNLSSRGFGPDQDVQSGSVTLSDATSPQVINDGGVPENYSIVHFSVPSGQDRLTAQVAYPGNPQGCLTEDCDAGFASRVEITLVDPSGKLAGSTAEQGPGNYGSVEVRYPESGTWTAVILGDNAANGGTNGTIKWRVATQKFDTFGSVSPSQLTLSPGQSQSVTVSASSPSSAGDADGSVVVSSASAGTTSIAVTTRALIEPSTGSSGGGTFSGSLTGGNGREGAEGQEQYYEFNVPSGITNITANVSLTNDAADPVGLYLVAPDGDTLGYGQNTFNGNSTLSATAYSTHPVAGTWTLIIDFAEPVQGDEISQTYTGNVAFNEAGASAHGLPNGKSTVLTPGKAVTVPVTITNNGSAPEDFFIDPRTDTYQSMSLATLSSAENYVPLSGEGPLWLVPTETKSLQIDQQSGLATEFDTEPIPGDPDLAASGFSSSGIGNSCGVATSVSYAPAGGAVTPGLWEAFPSECGPYPSAAEYTVANDTMTVLTKGFDQNITSPTGDLWQPASLGSTTSFTPVAVNPGQSVTIPVTITPAFVHNTTTFEGYLYIDTIDTDVAPDGQQSGTEATALPYEYTVDGTTVG